MKHLILTIIITSCEFIIKGEEYRITDECYIASNPELYLESNSYSKDTTYWRCAIANSNASYNVGHSLYEAYAFVNKYNCDNYPINFWDRFYMILPNETKCKDL